MKFSMSPDKSMGVHWKKKGEGGISPWLSENWVICEHYKIFLKIKMLQKKLKNI